MLQTSSVVWQTTGVYSIQCSIQYTGYDALCSLVECWCIIYYGQTTAGIARLLVHTVLVAAAVLAGWMLVYTIGMARLCM